MEKRNQKQEKHEQLNIKQYLYKQMIQTVQLIH